MAVRAHRAARQGGTAGNQGERSILTTIAAPLAGAVIGAAAYVLYPYVESFGLTESEARKNGANSTTGS